MREERKGLDLGGQGSREDLVGVDRGETLIRIHCEKNPFSINMFYI